MLCRRGCLGVPYGKCFAAIVEPLWWMLCCQCHFSLRECFAAEIVLVPVADALSSRSYGSPLGRMLCRRYLLMAVSSSLGGFFATMVFFRQPLCRCLLISQARLVCLGVVAVGPSAFSYCLIYVVYHYLSGL